MRELYILAVGIAVGISLGELLESYQRRIAYRAADIAEETLARRRRFENDCLECGAPPGSDPEKPRHHTWCSSMAPPPAPTPAPAPAAAA